MASNNLEQSLRWYQRWTGVMAVGVVATISIIILFIVGSSGYYYWQIKHGNGEILFDKFYGGFSDAGVKGQNTADKINRLDIETPDAPFLGNNTAKVTVVEFVDFKCPNCKAEAPILRQIIQKYGKDLKLIIRNFPVESTHPGANQLSVLAMCAFEQGFYWPLHDWLYASQDALGEQLSDAELAGMAVNFGWNADKMKTCMAGSAAKIKVNKDFADGYRFGVEGTPTFFINGEKVQGVIPQTAWETYLKNIK